jgi:hypothetical protein
MSAVAGRREKGLITNGSGIASGVGEFSAFNWYTADKISGDGCFAMNTNRYGSSLVTGPYTEVDPLNYTYRFSLCARTISRSYNNRLGSGHIGFACFDRFYNFIDHHEIANTAGAQLTRAANPGDTVFYINRGDWRNGTGHTISCNFFPATQVDYAYERAPGRYSEVSLYNSAWTSITQMSASEWRVNLSSGRTVPSGHSYPVGTWVYQTQAGGSYNYALGAPNYPENWTVYSTGNMTGFGDWSGAGFRWGTKYIRFLNLANYNYRTESAGNSAYYLFDNIMLLGVRNTKATKLSNLNSSFFNRSRIIR